MSAPYFKVGEEVILESKYAPHLNGECTVLEVIKSVRSFNVDTGERKTGNILYKLTIETPNGCHWSQSALRKKHEGGEDFKSLMNNLKSPISQGEVHE